MQQIIQNIQTECKTHFKWVKQVLFTTFCPFNTPVLSSVEKQLFLCKLQKPHLDFWVLDQIVRDEDAQKAFSSCTLPSALLLSAPSKTQVEVFCHK